MANDLVTQVPFDVTEFADNPEPRCPCVLVLDVSRSMEKDGRIGELNKGVRDFRADLAGDDLASKRVELAVVTFGRQVRVQADFQTVDYFVPVDLEADGETPMGEAVMTAVDLVETRKAAYRKAGIPYFRPWIMLLTDGGPTDEWAEAADRVQKGEKAKSFMLLPVGVGKDANMNVLSALSVRQPLRLKGLEFRSMFRWLSNSLRQTSHSQPGEVVRWDNPKGWGSE